MNNKTHEEQRRVWIKFKFHMILAVNQIVHKPLLLICFMPIVAFIIIAEIYKEPLLNSMELSRVFYGIYLFVYSILEVILPILFTIEILSLIANLTIKDDEENIKDAFDSTELRNGTPILVDKYKIKGSKYATQREFYSSIPLQTWIDKKEAIEDMMNISIIEDIAHNSRADGRKTVIISTPTREPIKRGDLYYEEI